MLEERKPQLSLDNFDAPGSANSRYILTSPTSLRACARLGIKPVELLPKSFSDFRLRFNEDVVSKIQGAYLEYEDQRRNKLETARRLRSRMKDIERGLPWQPPPSTPLLASLGGGAKADVELPSRGVSKEHYCFDSKALPASNKDSGVFRRLGKSSPQLPGCRKRAERRAQCKPVAKEEPGEFQNSFQKQLQERLQALESINKYDRTEKKEKIEERLRRAECHKDLQNCLREQQMRERFLHEELKKKCQLINLQHLEDKECIRRHILCKQRREMEAIAAAKRSIITRQKAEGAMRKNQEHKAKFERNRFQRELHTTVAQQYLEEDLQRRQQQAEDRLQQERAAREARIQDIVKKREQRSQRCKLTAHFIEQSLQKWRDEVDTRGRDSGQSAQLAVQKSVKKKEAHIRRVCEEKRQVHALNLARLVEREREKLESYQREVEQWQRGMQELNRKKQEEDDKSKAIAYYSSVLRNVLKDDITFAAKSKAVEARARLENRHCKSQTSNHLSSHLF